MVDDDARHAKAMREIQDGTKEKRDKQARNEAAGKSFVEETTVYLKDGGYSSCSTREFTVEYCILAISDNQGEVLADVQTKRQIDPDMDYGFVMRPLSALTLAVAAPGPLVEEIVNEKADDNPEDEGKDEGKEDDENEEEKDVEDDDDKEEGEDDEGDDDAAKS